MRVRKGEIVLEKANDYWKILRRAEEDQVLLKITRNIGESQGWFMRARCG